jgi:hypothetical protein
MHGAFRIAVAAATFALLPSQIAAAQSRTPPAQHTAKIAPKVGAIAPAGDAAAMAALLAGPGVAVSNATYRGTKAAAGTFSGAQGSIGIDSGVVLSTGEARNVVGPNVDTAFSTDNAQPGDSALDLLVAPYETYDAAVLEFDLIPSDATISVRYVFASEEYNEFVGSPYNDVVAIFVNGVNCANQGGQPVSVNTINHGINDVLYVDNATGLRDTEMDGMTVPLDCVAAVTPGAVNRVKIAIADTSDAVWDAAVFLAAGGLRSPGVGPLTSSSIVKVIEYRHAEWDHYFMTANIDEVAKLDNGTFVGWARTGQAFNVFVSGTPGTAEVCRFFSTSFDPKSSHFYTPSAPECATVKANPDWQFEGAVFNVSLPAKDGSCPSGTQALYRLYNDGMGAAPNHRYTTDFAIFAVMQQLGWTPEGEAIGVIACVPT